MSIQCPECGEELCLGHFPVSGAVLGSALEKAWIERDDLRAALAAEQEDRRQSQITAKNAKDELRAEKAAHAETRATAEGERRAHQKTNLYTVRLETQVEILRNGQFIALDNQSALVVQVRAAEARATAAEQEAGRLREALTDLIEASTEDTLRYVRDAYAVARARAALEGKGKDK